LKAGGIEDGLALSWMLAIGKRYPTIREGCDNELAGVYCD
jgi:hypothetical protein